MVKNPPANAERHKRQTQVRSLAWEDPLEKEMAPHSRILAWRIPWTEEPHGLQSMWSQSGTQQSTQTSVLILSPAFSFLPKTAVLLNTNEAILGPTPFIYFHKK